ncbi:MAG: hypothetical protein ACE365_01530 [Gammaproteobacteria bacterium]
MALLESIANALTTYEERRGFFRKNIPFIPTEHPAISAIKELIDSNEQKDEEDLANLDLYQMIRCFFENPTSEGHESYRVYNAILEEIWKTVRAKKLSNETCIMKNKLASILKKIYLYAPNIYDSNQLDVILNHSQAKMLAEFFINLSSRDLLDDKVRETIVQISLIDFTPVLAAMDILEEGRVNKGFQKTTLLTILNHQNPNTMACAIAELQLTEQFNSENLNRVANAENPNTCVDDILAENNLEHADTSHPLAIKLYPKKVADRADYAINGSRPLLQLALVPEEKELISLSINHRSNLFKLAKLSIIKGKPKTYDQRANYIWNAVLSETRTYREKNVDPRIRHELNTYNLLKNIFSFLENCGLFNEENFNQTITHERINAVNASIKRAGDDMSITQENFQELLRLTMPNINSSIDELISLFNPKPSEVKMTDVEMTMYSSIEEEKDAGEAHEKENDDQNKPGSHTC